MVPGSSSLSQERAASDALVTNARHIKEKEIPEDSLNNSVHIYV